MFHCGALYDEEASTCLSSLNHTEEGYFVVVVVIHTLVGSPGSKTVSTTFNLSPRLCFL